MRRVVFGVAAAMALSLASGASAAPDAGARDASPVHDAGVDLVPLDGSTGATTALACGTPPGMIPDSGLPPSCNSICEKALCVPNAAISSDAERAALPDCDGNSQCVPEFLIITLGKVRFKECRSIANAEGRCVPTCLARNSSSASSYLTQDTCGANELCAPCYNPLDGKETGACTLGCTLPPTEPKVVFGPCCSGAGMCVPVSLVPKGAEKLFQADVCTKAGDVCVPTDLSNLGASLTSFACLARPSTDAGAHVGPDASLSLPDASPVTKDAASGGSTGAGGASTCSGPACELPAEAGTCTVGTTEACRCSDGGTGKRTCAAGGPGACVCTGTGAAEAEDGGCGCRTTREGHTGGGVTLALATTLLAAGRRRRARKRVATTPRP